MIKVSSIATQSEVEVDRYIGKFENDPSLPTVVVFGGIHGNEPSGVFALKRVCDHITQNNIELRGNFYALTGNMCSLPEGRRFCDVDLNRIWIDEAFSKIRGKESLNGHHPKEYSQMQDLLHEIETITARNKGPFYFIDLHTTSSQSCPFIPINDTLANRAFAEKFPVPTVLGIEEFLDGPLLSYINELDHVSLGFEGGHHDDKKSIHHHIAFVSLSLMFSGLITHIEFPDYKEYLSSLEAAGKQELGMYEIRQRYHVNDNASFSMLPGFNSFDKIRRRQHLADEIGLPVLAGESGKIFMPLYQSQGEDGFFIIRKISPFWLKLSSLLRRYRFENLLPLLPGVKRDALNPKTLIVNQLMARFLAKEIFHLLGFKMKSRESHYLRFTRRESFF